MLSRAWLKNSSYMKKASYFRFSHSLCSSPFPVLLRAGDFFFFFFLSFYKILTEHSHSHPIARPRWYAPVTPKASPSPPHNQATITTWLLMVLLSYWLALQWPLLQATSCQRATVSRSFRQHLVEWWTSGGQWSKMRSWPSPWDELGAQGNRLGAVSCTAPGSSPRSSIGLGPSLKAAVNLSPIPTSATNRRGSLPE